MDFAHKLGKRIKELRKKAGKTQEQLAETAGTSSKYFGEIERGEVNVSAYILVKIAEVLGVDMLQLLDFDHLENTEVLKKEIMELLDKADNEEVRQIYRVVNAMLK